MSSSTARAAGDRRTNEVVGRVMADRFIVRGPAAGAALLRGIEQMVGLLRPTLGPIARTVVVAPLVSGPPEVLDSAATIARRTIQLADPFEDMGGMIVRHAVWRVFERAGDGTATAAVLVPPLVRAAARYVASGSSAVLIRRGVERGLELALAELRRQARPIELPAEIAGVVAGTLGDPKLAEMIGEIVDSVGPDGAILVEDAHGTETVYEYVDGVRWNEGYLSPFLLAGETTARLLEPRILVTDYIIETVDQLRPAVEACVVGGERNLFVVAPEIRDAALALLIVNRERGVLDQAVAVKAPSFGTQRSRIVEDIAVTVGARPVRQDVGERLEDVTLADLGHARQAWATRSAFGILGGRGDKAAIRERVRLAKGELGGVVDDNYTRDKIRERIGKLTGAAARILVGAPTQPDQAELKVRIEAAVRAARAATAAGVVAGGGAALLACAPALEAEAEGMVGDEAVGLRILARALGVPMRTIAANAGLAPAPILHEARQRGPGWTFDVVRQAWVDSWEAGLVDSASVLLTALETGVSAATATMTADVLIHRKKPPVSTSP